MRRRLGARAEADLVTALSPLVGTGLTALELLGVDEDGRFLVLLPEVDGDDAVPALHALAAPPRPHDGGGLRGAGAHGFVWTTAVLVPVSVLAGWVSWLMIEKPTASLRTLVDSRGRARRYYPELAERR